MTGLVRKATLLSACGLVIAGVAMAGNPNITNSQKPCILLMDMPNSNTFGGVNPGVCGVNALKVIVRDDSNLPVQNISVGLDFSTCTAGNIKLADTQPDPDVTTFCGGGNRAVYKNTSNLGEVCFAVIGGTNIVDLSSAYVFYTGQPVRNIGPSAGQVCCKIYAGSTLLDTKMVIVNEYDLKDDNVDVNAGDGSYHLDAIGQTAPIGYRTYGDYNCDGGVDAGDGSLHLDAIGNSCISACPYTGTYCP